MNEGIWTCWSRVSRRSCMGNYFKKFPRTHWLPIAKPHVGERQLTSSETQELFSEDINVSEKMDGANVGIQVVDGEILLQKRGGFIGAGEHPQYGAFKTYVLKRYEKIHNLPRDLVFFGEWCYAKHSVYYNSLPDYLLIFDIFDEERNTFLCARERDEIAREHGFEVVPTFFEGKATLDEIPQMIRRSFFSEELMEGVVVRNDILDATNAIRGKYVREGFIAGDKHWSKKQLVKNRAKVGL